MSGLFSIGKMSFERLQVLTRVAALCVFALLACAPAGSVQAAAKGVQGTSLPVGVQHAIAFLNLYKDSRHVKLAMKVFASRHPETSKLAASRELFRQLKMKPIKAGMKIDARRVYVAETGSRHYYMTSAAAKKLVGAFMKYLLAHRDFEAMFDTYHAGLNFGERLGIKVLAATKSKGSLTKNEGRKFIQGVFKKRTRKILSEIGS